MSNNNTRRDLLPTRAVNTRFTPFDSRLASTSTGWKAALLRKISRAPVSCTRSIPIQSEDVPPLDFVYQHTPHVKSSTAPTPCEEKSPHITSQQSLKLLLESTLEKATEIHKASLANLQSEANLLRSENASLQKMLIKLRFERDVARRRIQMLNGTALPKDVGDRILQKTSPAKMGSKRKRDENATLQCHAETRQEQEHDGIFDDYILQYPINDMVDDSQSLIKRRRTSTESLGTEYSATSTAAEIPSTTYFAYSPELPDPTSSFFDYDCRDNHHKLECEDPHLTCFLGEGEKDMDLASESSV